MDKIIGLGYAGSTIARKFSQYPQYDICTIDSVDADGAHIKLPRCNTPEEYEASVPDLSSRFADMDGDILFIIGGGGKISGAALRILQQLRHTNINVLYIVPELSALSNRALLQNRLAFNVLQEYARSGMFRRLYLASNKALEDMVGDVPLLQLNDKMNNIIVNAFHYYNVFSNTEPLMKSYEEPSEINRVATFGVYDVKNGEERLFFPLDGARDKCYYYCINEETINSDGRLFKTIKEQVAKEKIHASYQIHSTKHLESFAYTLGYTNQIQGLDKLN